MNDFPAPTATNRVHASPRVALLGAITSSALVLAVMLGLAVVIARRANTNVLGAPIHANTTTPAVALSGRAVHGRELYLFNCAHCHSDDATGDEGPNLFNLKKSDARISKLILDGIKGEMPAFSKKLNTEDVSDLLAYLRTLKTNGMELTSGSNP